MSRKSHTRRKRRIHKAVLKHGKNAKRRHARKSGRTGSIMAKKNHSTKSAMENNNASTAN